MEPAVFLPVAFVLGILMLFRSPGWRMPQLAGAPALTAVWAGPDDEEDEEQRPETDRAPAPLHPLPWAVAALGLVRVALLVVLGA